MTVRIHLFPEIDDIAAAKLEAIRNEGLGNMGAADS